MMNKPDVIINGKSIANVPERITRHVMIFKSGIAELCAVVLDYMQYKQSSMSGDRPKLIGGY